jgi:tetratricopeptide (TPR) repeat protein
MAGKERPAAQTSSVLAGRLFAEALRHHQAGRLNEAEPLYRQVLAFDRRHSDSLHLLGVIAWQTGRYDMAADLIDKAIAVNPKAAAYHSNLGLVFKDQGQLDKAVASYRRAIALKPDYPDAHNNLGAALRDLGQFEEAIAGFEHALQSGGDPCFAYYEISRCRKFTEADRLLVAQMDALLADCRFSDSSRSVLHFALGKIFDDLAEYEVAIRHFDEANRLELGQRRFDPSHFAALVDRLVGAFPIDRPSHSPIASVSELPILIAGMPRSGTTLVEQIMVSHPKVAAGGELGFWLRQLDRIEPPSAAAFSPAADGETIRSYLGLLNRISPLAPRITDKMPYNFLALGLVSRLFPKAKIIHCRRNPVDTALSIYFTRFAKRHEFANSRSGIVQYYKQYRRLMEHWRALLSPAQFLEIEYEALIADREAVSRRLVAFCGLDWDAACLDFHKTNRRIDTASAWQARQPIYPSAVDRWRRYEPWLGEFRELLA